ncbi:Protein of unknown function [Saccharopolyspora antimicrobica]|uniref:Uncharacterized protein DUF3263 n=1 Tax=Saccharopolyspora antimicrobica TaxID=455193 RepID=A0A1I5J024_9PSEU|nr:uncharacterized protein DUF3263 [Saccharopolyspora antimicrobica]SFO65786.1 Protein of unknown function [Saccharopolyspora antimicrobica]
MDAAQMLTAQEIARQCEQLARGQEQRGTPEGRRLRAVEPVAEPVAAPAPAPEPEPEPSGELTNRERGVLAFESQWWKRSGAKEQAIRELFDMSPSRYYQVLNALLDSPAAFRADPMLIKRLRKARAARQRERAAQRLGIELH